MGQRKVYIDFVDGSGFIDVSDFVKYDTLSIQEVAFNDSYKAAQNTCSFSLIYDASIYTKVTSTTVNMPLRIFDLREGAVLHTESDQPILTETGMQILVETSVAVPVFTGHIPPKSSREYNGILDNTIIKLNATDNMDYMDVEVGDILYANCAVMNPSDPANSIVHKLALIAGWDTTRVSSVSIPTVILRFSPPDAKATVRTVLDVLLYEYGYALALDKADYVSPIQWNVSIPSTMPEFNEDNAILEVSISNSINKYDGVKVIYYDMNSANNMRVYRDSNCGYASDGTFSGYGIPNNTDYPPAANAIDETTGNKQIVYQEYTDDAIKYATNKAIQQKLDYNYKNYSSDFTAIISTEGHYVDRRFENPLTVVTEIFGNKKCRLLYRNTTGSPVLLYYNDVYATVWYKSAERTAIKNLVTTPTDVFSYTSTYIYSKAIGDALALAIAAQYKSGLKTYEIQSEIDYSIGSIARVVLSGEGTNAYVLIQNKSWDEAKEIYTYTCISYVATREELTSQTVSETAALNAAETYASIHSIGTPEAVQTALTDVQTILQGQIDGKVACFYQDTAPVSTAEYTLCDGDLWFDTNDGNNQYRYNGSNWIDVRDTGIAAAYNLAGTKNTIFATIELAQAGAIIGDLFIDNGIMYRCKVAAGAINIGNSTRLTIKNFGKLASAPSSGMITNDTYYNTSNYTSYYYNGSSWIVATDSTSDIVASTAPSYRGIGILAGTTTAAFPGATVNNSGVITVGSSVTPNKGDWMTNYNSTNVALGMYVWSGTTWIVTNDVDYISSAAIDLCNLQVGGTTISGFNTFTSAIIKTLFAQQINVLDPGYIQSSNYDTGNAGFKLDSDGFAELNNVSVRGTVDATGGDFSGDITVSGTLTTENASQKTLIDPSGIQVQSKADLSTMTIDDGGISVYNSLGQLDGFFRGSVTSTKLSSAYRFRTKAFYQTVASSWYNVIIGTDYYNNGTRYVGMFILSFETYTTTYQKCGFIAEILVSHFQPGVTTPSLYLFTRALHSDGGIFNDTSSFIRINGNSIQIQNTGGQFIYCSILAIG